jgi:hypothetical protein
VTARPATRRYGVAFFLAAGVGAAALNAIFQRIGARRIAVDDLGAFNALVGIIGGIGLLGLGLQVVIARLRPDAAEGGDGTLALGRLAVIAGTLTGALVAIAVPGPSWYRLEVGALMAVSATATFCGVAPRARLLRRSSWSRLAIVYLVGAGVRLGALRPMIELVETQLLAILAATALSEVAMSLLAWRLAPFRLVSPTRVGRDDARRLVLGFVALGGLWMLTVADTVLARTRLSDADADAYAFASTVARSTFLRRSTARAPRAAHVHARARADRASQTGVQRRCPRDGGDSGGRGCGGGRRARAGREGRSSARTRSSSTSEPCGSWQPRGRRCRCSRC